MLNTSLLPIHFDNTDKFTVFIDLDFETRSEAKLVKKESVTAWKYAEHPSTEVLILRYSIEGGKTYRWLYGDRPPKRLFRALRKGLFFRAHHSFFEFVIWNLCAVPKLGWPAMPIEKFYCTQAMGCTHAFQAKLEDAGDEMGLEVTKDKEGKRLINMFSTPSRKQGELFKEPKNYWEEFLRFDKYCDVDVLTQQGIVEYLPLLTPLQYSIFMLTAKMNERGVPIDAEMAKGAIKLERIAKRKANREARKLTKGAFKKLSQREAVLDWLNDNGCPIPNMQAKTIERVLKNKKGKIPRKAYRVLELRYQTTKTSTAKYPAALQRIASDGRVHETLAYHIAKTGRWGGRGLQVQNFARPSLPKWVDYEYIAELIANGDLETIEWLYGDVMNVLSSALRSMIKAPEGMKLIAADYAQIEARLVFWFADEQKALDIFRRGEDVYVDMASGIYGIPAIKVTDDQRFIGKQTVLGLGFQMGAAKFKSQLYDQYDTSISKEFAKEAVNLYRTKYKKVKALWSETNKAAMNAVLFPGRKFKCAGRKITYFVEEDFLYCRLPSGRKLAYHLPVVKEVPNKWGGDKPMQELSFMGFDSYTRKWKRQTTYGGSLVENYVQASSADITGHGMLEGEKENYEAIFTVHDEVIALVPEDFGSYKEYEEILCRLPKWAEGLPVEAEGWEGIRYRK